ncbi:MAG: TIGR04283 family arsenosugar biosynthesis glycosyltransferase [Desulfamplus sp.]|nr:TIGR04283 family arsenosugar biosynthesis glycosyltransferase [Desulfamplus sp.]
MFSFVIPVLYEGASINSSINQLYHQFSGYCFEIIVVDGDPNKSTIQQILSCNSISSNNFNLKLISAKQGRGSQMNAGANIADGKILIFLHADTKMPSDALKHIFNVIQKEQYKVGAFKLRFDSQRKIYRFIEFFASLRCRLTLTPYGDQAIFITKSYFQQIGKFSEIPIMEDIDLMLRIKKGGEKVYISNKYVKTSSRRWEKEGVGYCAIRSSILALLFRLGVSPYRLLKYYRVFRNLGAA